jgi:hypothetical protein
MKGTIALEPGTKKGYVYILVNPTFSGFVKIGKTTKNPEIRARELSAGTGVPAPYAVVWDEFVTDCDHVEKLLHEHLAHTRSRNDREFFAIPLKKAISIASHIVSSFLCEIDVPVPDPTNPVIVSPIESPKISRSNAPLVSRRGSAAYTRLLEMMGVGHSLGEHPYGGTYIEYPGKGFNRICLYEYDNAPHNTFSLVIHSGDTCKQAKELYQHFSYAKAVGLEKIGWTIRNNFHFAWQNKNIVSTNGDKALPLREYIDYWSRALREGGIRKYNKNEFGLLQRELAEAKVMDQRDISAFDEFFRTHEYQSAITCPGIINWLSFSKERLHEESEALAAELRDKTMSLIEIYDHNIS